MTHAKMLRRLICSRKVFRSFSTSSSNIIRPPELDVEYLCNPENLNEIQTNVSQRKGVGNISLVQELYKETREKILTDCDADSVQKFYSEAKKIPNKSHPSIQSYGNEPKVLRFINPKPEFKFKPRDFHDLSKQLNLVRTEHLGNLAGNRAYFFTGELAKLEQALIKYTIDKLLKDNFQLISVPDILDPSIVEQCGMTTRGERNQVYFLDEKLHQTQKCLSGTAEMALAGFLMNKTFQERDLPMKLVAVSRCYRAETSSVIEERGIFRVHQFTKVEMFGAALPEASEELLEHFRAIEEDLFAGFGLHLQVLDMPPHDLGASAYRKYDMEAWMPGRGVFGEVSSCSNCTDYQSRRLGVKLERNGRLEHVHTVNGTACAIPRLLIALLETHQAEDGTVAVPQVLRGYMDGAERIIDRQKMVPELRLVKFKH